MIPDPVRRYMARSMYYVEKNRYLILEFLNSADILSCEDTGERIATHLDTQCGIDCIVIGGNTGISRGVGCRFQIDNPGRWREKFRTFTFRKERDTGTMTEFEKRRRAIETGGLYPYWTLHGYIDPESEAIDRMAVAKTEDIIWFIETMHPDTRHTRSDQYGQASFYTILWSDFKKSGRKIKIYERGKPALEYMVEETSQMSMFM